MPLMERELYRPVEEQFEILSEGTVDLVTPDELRRKLERSNAQKKALVVKVGFDPTAPDIHLGHTVLLRKMRQFQDLGHRVIFLIGDFTGMIGDPSGRSATRPALTHEQILDNAETYKRQCYKVLDPDVTEIRFNNEWLGELGSQGFIRLAARYNVARMLERNDFKKRYQSGQSISLHEFLYPMAQAYDSVALEADVELGGTDQLFNLNVGRDIMPGYGLEPQVVMTTPLIEGTDGVEKMSKSMGNYIGVEEPPREIYGKVMSISDDLMWRYYAHCTDTSEETVEGMREMVRRGTLHPKKTKEGLALRIVTDLYDEGRAKEAREEFERIFKQRGLPDEIPEHRFEASEGKVFLPKLMTATGLASSRNEANRMLGQGAVSIDGERISGGVLEIDATRGATILLKVGKRRFARVTID